MRRQPMHIPNIQHTEPLAGDTWRPEPRTSRPSRWDVLGPQPHSRPHRAYPGPSTALIRRELSSAWPDPTHARHCLPPITTALHGVARARVCVARVELRQAWQALAHQTGRAPEQWMMLQASLTVVAQQGTPDDLFAATADFCHLADNYLRSLWRSIRHKQNLSIFGEVQTALSQLSFLRMSV